MTTECNGSKRCTVSNNEYDDIHARIDHVLESKKDLIENIKIKKYKYGNRYASPRTEDHPLRNMNFSPRYKKHSQLYFVGKNPEQDKKKQTSKDAEKKKFVKVEKNAEKPKKSSLLSKAKSKDSPTKSSEKSKSSPPKKAKAADDENVLNVIGKVEEDESNWLEEQIKNKDENQQKPSQVEKKLSQIEKQIHSGSSKTDKEEIESEEHPKLEKEPELKNSKQTSGNIPSPPDVKESSSPASEESTPFQTPPNADNTTPDHLKNSSDQLQTILENKAKPPSPHILSLKDQTLQKLGFSSKQWKELDFYPLFEPFAYVEIIRDSESLDKRYVLIEVQLSEDEQQALDYIKETLAYQELDTDVLDEKGLETYLLETIDRVIEEYNMSFSDTTKQKIIYYLEKYYLGLGLIDALMKDSHIEDISCDGANVPIFLYHREYGSLKSNILFDNEDDLSGFVVRLAQKCGKHISIAEPMLDATMPDGSRIQMTLSTEVTAKGSTFTIRKFKEDPFSPPDLIEFNTMSAEMVAYMWMAVENGVNALIAGGTAAGKTSTLNALSLFIPRDAKIVTIEETREINLPHPNWIPGVARSGFGEVVADRVVGEIDMYDLMKAALRQRPEYILVGEIRGKEAYVLFQAMATGHTTYSTAHADSAQSLIHRLEGKPIEIPRIMLQALDIVCIQVTTRVKNKRARRCKQIIEIIDIDPTTKEILTNEVFRWDPVEDSFTYSGKSYVLESIRVDKDFDREQMTNEIKNRSKLMHWMNQNNIRDFREVAIVLAQYAETPETIMKKVNS